MGYARRRRMRRIQESRSQKEAPLQITKAALEIVEAFRVDLNMLKGTGSGGRITVKDVDKYLKERTRGDEEE